MRIRRLVYPALLAGSVLLNGVFGYIFCTYAANHGGWAYIRERTHTGQPVTGMHVATTQERRVTLRMAPKVPGQILFMGDSLTQAGPWTDFFPGYPVQNRGIGTSTVRDGINLVQDGVLSGKPAKIFLQYGVNDFGVGTSVDGFIAEYVDLLDAVKKAAPDAKIYVQSTAPSQWVKGNTADPATQREANVRLADLAARRGCTFIDIYSHLALDSETGLPARLSVDRIHLTPEAYKIWVDVIRPYVEEGATSRPAARDQARSGGRPLEPGPTGYHGLGGHTA